MIRDLVDLYDLKDADVARLLATALELEREPRRDLARGRVLGLLFFNPSLRTLASMQSGMAQLGGASFVIQPGQGSWKLETAKGAVMDGEAAEHIEEAIPVLEQYCDVLGVRCFEAGNNLGDALADRFLQYVRSLARKPLINLESASGHPCQGLADWKTLEDLDIPKRGRLVLSWAWHPKALPLSVPATVVSMAAMRGMELVVLRPKEFALPDQIMERARGAAKASGGSITETDRREDALEGAHVLYAKSWGAPSCYGRPEEESKLRAPYRDWCVREDWFRAARREAVFMHCLPVRRNVVVADEILDGPRNRVVQQAGNRLHVQKAVLCELLESKKGQL